MQVAGGGRRDGRLQRGVALLTEAAQEVHYLAGAI